jgi:hypothetical protein
LRWTHIISDTCQSDQEDFQLNVEQEEEDTDNVKSIHDGKYPNERMKLEI